jgi:hypothetical protein
MQQQSKKPSSPVLCMLQETESGAENNNKETMRGDESWYAVFNNCIRYII